MGNITPVKIIGALIVVLLIAFVILLTKKDNSNPNPTPGTTPSSTPGTTPSSTPGTTPSSTPGTTPSSTPGTSQDGGRIQTLQLYDAKTGQALSQDNACYTCKNKVNPCACYINRNCSLSQDNFVIPSVCNYNDMPCLQYETQDENGGAGVCNQDGLNLYRNAIIQDTNSMHSYLCNTSEDKVRNCQRQCSQHDYPFSSIPFCSACCENACSTIDCSNFKPGGGPKGTLPPPPSDGRITCQECDTLHKMGDAAMVNAMGINYAQCKSNCI